MELFESFEKKEIKEFFRRRGGIFEMVDSILCKVVSWMMLSKDFKGMDVYI